MTKILTIMALPSESDGVFEKHNIDVLYTGVGKINAAYNLMKKLRNESFDIIFNCGTAGSHKLKGASTVECNKFIQRDMDVKALGFDMGQTPFEDNTKIIKNKKFFPNLKSVICGTGDNFATQMPKVECDILDMEAYSIAKICSLENIPFACIKYISDGADEKSAKDWQDNVHKAAEIYYEHYQILLSSNIDI